MSPQDAQGHTWAVDEAGVCEYDQGYLCPCGARKVVMAEGDTKHTRESATQCRVKADLDYVRPVVGMHVDLLIAQELAAFDRLVAAGIAYRAYEGAAGVLGLAKVRLNDPRP